MPASILPITKRFFGRAVYLMRHTPSGQMLPLLNHYIHKAVIHLKPSDPNGLLPLLKSYLARTFPDREVTAVNNFRYINKGWENNVYSFNVVWGPARSAKKEDLILRIYPGAYAQDRAEREVRTLNWLYKVGYPVPCVYRFDSADRSPFGKPCLLMEQIHGHTMGGDLFRSTPDCYKKYLPIFCGLFIRLHTLDWRSFVPNPEQYEPSSPYSVVEATLKQNLPYFESHMAPGFRPVWDWLTVHTHDVPSDGPVLVHQDFHGNNILVKDCPEPGGEEAVVIDWTAATLTDYRFDLAWSQMLIGVNDGWHFRDPVLHEYERQAGKTVTGLDFFEVYVSFTRLLMLIASISSGADSIGLRAGTEERMRSQAPSMRKVYEHQLHITGITIPEVETFLKKAEG